MTLAGPTVADYLQGRRAAFKNSEDTRMHIRKIFRAAGRPAISAWKRFSDVARPGADARSVATSPDYGEQSSSLDAVLAGLRERELRPFAAGSAQGDRPAGIRYDHRFATRVVPASSLLRFILASVIRARELPAYDKVAWEFAFEFNGNPCRLRWGKWGVALALWMTETDQERAHKIASDIESRLIKATTSLHRRIVSVIIQHEVDENRVELVNQYVRARGMVDYFARLLQDARPPEPRDPITGDTDLLPSGLVEAFGRFQASAQHEQERAYLATALVAGYFAYMQHVLVLLSAFSRRALDEDFSFRELLDAGWADQFDTAFPPPHEPRIAAAKSDLSRLASEYRNPLLHGGGRPAFDGMFVTWAPGHTALATEDGELSDQFMLWRPALSADQIDEVLERIQRIDTAVEQHPFFAWVRSGLPANFHPEAVRRARQALDDGRADSYTEAAERAFDDLVNFDRTPRW